MCPLDKFYHSSQILKDLISTNTSFYLIRSLTHSHKFILSKYSSNLGSLPILNPFIYIHFFYLKRLYIILCLLEPFLGEAGQPARLPG
jgi:hypothetical protein